MSDSSERDRSVPWTDDRRRDDAEGFCSREIEAVADTESDAITFVSTRSEHVDPTTTWITADAEVVVDVGSVR